MNEKELKAFQDAKIEQAQRELEEFDRKQVERRRREHPEEFSQADLPDYSRPWNVRRKDYTFTVMRHDPDESIRRRARRDRNQLILGIGLTLLAAIFLVWILSR